MVIIVPPRATFWRSWPEIPNLNSLEAKSAGSMSVGLPSRLRRTSHQANRARETAPIARSSADRLAALLPDEDAQHQAAHAEDREERPDEVDLAWPGVRHVADEPAAEQDDRDDHDLEAERHAVRQERRDEAADERSDRRRDRRRGADQGVGRLLGRALEVAVDERLHGRQQERRAEPADDRPEDEDRRPRSGTGPSPGRRPRMRAGR